MRKYQNFFLLLCSLFFSLYSFAQQPLNQINILSFSVKSKLPADTYTWTTLPGAMFLTAQRVPQAALQGIKLVVQIKQGNGKICGNSLEVSPLLDFSTVKTFTTAELSGYIANCTTLKPGNYSICAQFFNLDRYPISKEVCKEFIVEDAVQVQQNYNPPQNINPVNDKVFKPAEMKGVVMFKWAPVVPKPKEPVTYRLKIWQLMQGQNGTQAIKSNTPVIEKEVTNITQAVVTNLYTGPCKLPYLCEYVWTVQALNKDQNPICAGDCKSELYSFKVNDTTAAPNTQRTAAPSCTTTSTTVFTTGSSIFLSDGFVLKLTEIPTGGNAQLTGKGTVDVQWIGVLNVQFDSIQINGADKLCGGAVYTISDSKQEYPTQWATNVLNNTGIPAWTSIKIKKLVAGIDSTKLTKPLIAAGNNITFPASIPLNMPLGYFQSGDAAFGALGFTEMVFKPEIAEFEVIASLKTSKVFKEPAGPMYGTDGISVQGKGIEFTKTGLKGINGEIKLVDNIAFTYATTDSANLKITFNKEDSSGHLGNAVIFSDTASAFWTYKLDVNVQLPLQWLKPVDDSKPFIDLNFQTQIVKWDNFILQTTIPACIIPNTNGIGFDSTTIVYDHSNTANFSAMQFPDNYGAQESSEMFSGFYIPNFNMTLPEGLRNYADTSKPIQVGAYNLIINKEGITGKILAHNIVTYPFANVGNLAASIDTVEVELFKKVLTQARMNGMITLPMASKDDTASSIIYEALFVPASVSEDTTRSLTFTLKPNRDIQSKFFGKAKLKIEQTSSLSLIVKKKKGSKREITLDMELNGKIYYPAGQIANPLNPAKPFDLNINSKFEQLKMLYENVATEKFKFQPGVWKLPETQTKLAGFPFTIKEVKPIIGAFALNGQYLFKGGIEFVAKINLGSEKSKIAIAGDVKIQLLGGIKSSNFTVVDGDTVGSKIDHGFLSNLKPEFLGVRVSEVDVDVNMVAAAIKGRIAFYKEDPIYGTGFLGVVAAKFKTLSLGVSAGVIFGNTKTIPGNVGPGFKYWMVQAQTILPLPGVVFMPGVAFRGFGAGVFSKMRMRPPRTFSPSAANSTVFAGAEFTPDDTVALGFKVKAIIATTPKEETLNGSIALTGEFNTMGGMNFIQIDGTYACGAKIGEETKSFATGDLSVHYNFVDKIFDLQSDLVLDVRPKKIDIYTPAPIKTVLYIDGKKNQWYFKSGTPTKPMSINAFGINAQSYLMFGNYLGADIPTDFMKATRDGWASVGLGPTAFSDKATSEGKYKTAKGFALGSALNFRKTDNLSFPSWDGLCWNGSGYQGVRRYLEIYYNVAAGGEVDASLLQYNGCTGFNNGWRAKVSAAVYAGVSVTYDYNLLGGGCYSHQGTIVDIAAGASATVEFPNTTYFKGTISGHWEICGFSRNFTKDIEEGSQCAGTEVQLDPAINQNIYTQENAADSLKKKLITNIITPSSATDVSRQTYFSALLDYPYNEPFDVQEQQVSGQMNVRTFRVMYTASLTQDTVIASGAMSAGTSLNAAAFSTESPAAVPVTGLSALVVTSSVSISKNKGVIKSPVASAAIVTATISPALLKETILLQDAGYDELGAKRFKLQGVAGLSTAASLKINTGYKFFVGGVLQENIGGIWKAVHYKNTTIPIIQNKILYFKTNSEPIDLPSSGSSILTSKS